MGLRTLAERMSQGVVLKRRLPQAFGGGRLFVAPRGGGMRYWRRNMMKMDPHLFGLADEFRGALQVALRLTALYQQLGHAYAHRLPEFDRKIFIINYLSEYT